MTNRLRVGVLISGGGTTLKNLIHCRDNGTLDVDFRLVISSTKSAAGLQIAQAANIPTMVVAKTKSTDSLAHSHHVFQPFRERQVELVVMGGYLQHVLIPDDFEDRVINIHPSLIPSFCGHGMYGIKVHEEAIRFGVKVSGCTVHYVDNEYDHGPIILQRACDVLPEDTPETLQRRVFELECLALPEAIRQIMVMKENGACAPTVAV